MRLLRYLLLVATVLTAVAIAQPASAAAPADVQQSRVAHGQVAPESEAVPLAGCAILPTPPPGARNLGNHFFCRTCTIAGDRGVSSGAWVDYVCVPRQVGLDIYYYLYVWP